MSWQKSITFMPEHPDRTLGATGDDTFGVAGNKDDVYMIVKGY
jgi:hypothetical protein